MKDFNAVDVFDYEVMGCSRVINHPVAIYLTKLNSKKSRRTMRCNLDLAVKSLKASNDVLTFNWSLLSESLVRMMLNRVAGDHSPATVNTALSALKGVAKVLWRQKVLSNESYAEIADIKSYRGTRKGSGRMLERREIRAIFDYLDKNSDIKATRDAALISVMLGCGLRRSEIAGLKMEDIDLKKHSFAVIGKGNKQKICYLPEDCFKRLKLWLEYRGSDPGFLFYALKRDGSLVEKGLTDQRVYDIMRELCAAVKLKRFSPHDLRRTYASYLIDSGTDLITVRDLMGHASVATTQIYDRRDEKRKQSASEKIDFAA